jgi:hypothetical protein
MSGSREARSPQAGSTRRGRCSWDRPRLPHASGPGRSVSACRCRAAAYAGGGGERRGVRASRGTARASCRQECRTPAC